MLPTTLITTRGRPISEEEIILGGLPPASISSRFPERFNEVLRDWFFFIINDEWEGGGILKQWESGRRIFDDCEHSETINQGHWQCWP